MRKAEPIWEMVLYGVSTKKLGQLGLKGPYPGRAVVEFKGGARQEVRGIVEMRRG